MEKLQTSMRGAEKIASTYYESKALQLTVGFDSGRTYVFYDVPPFVAETLLCAKNRRAYIQSSIRPWYQWAEVGKKKKLSIR